MSYSKAEIDAIAKELAGEIDTPADSKKVVLERLLPHKDFTREMDEVPVTGSFAYQMGEGGFIVKVREGEGRIVFRGEGKHLDLAMEATTVGAQIVGSSQWGGGLAMGIEDPKEYQGESYDAAAGTKGVLTSTLVPKGPSEPHEVRLLGTATGLSAGVAGEWLEITVDR